MADNRDLASLSGNCAADEATYSGDTAVIQLVKPVFVTGSEGSKTVAPLEAGGGTEATALRVTIASDSTGVLSIDDNGGAITVDGTVTANLSATDNAVLDDIAAQALAIKTAVETLDNAIAGSEMQVDIVSSALPTGAATLAEQQTQTTALQLIDDTVATLGTTTYTEATTKGIVMGAVRRDADTTLANTTNEITPLQVDANGYLKVEVFSGATLPMSLASASVASGALASGSIASGAVASGAFASGALASGSIAAGAIAAGATSIAENEDVAHADGDRGVKILQRRIDTPATSAGTSGDYATPNQSAEGAAWGTLTPTTTGGCTIFRSLDLDESEEEIKATAGNLYGYFFGNVATSVRYLKFYNATAANVTVGSTTPVLTFPLPASSSGHIALPYPAGFATAITAAVTTGVADADTGAPAANDVILNVFYK